LNDLFVSGSEGGMNTDTLMLSGGFMDSNMDVTEGGEAFSIYTAAGTDARLIVDDDVMVALV